MLHLVVGTLQLFRAVELVSMVGYCISVLMIPFEKTFAMKMATISLMTLVVVYLVHRSCYVIIEKVYLDDWRCRFKDLSPTSRSLVQYYPNYGYPLMFAGAVGKSIFFMLLSVFTILMLVLVVTVKV